MQVDASGACWLDADEHHLGLAPGTGGAFNCSEWSDGRHALRLGHNASLPQIGGSATLSVTGNALGSNGDVPSMRLKEFQRELIRPAYGRKVSANRYSGAAGLRHQRSTGRCVRLSPPNIGSALARKRRAAIAGAGDSETKSILTESIEGGAPGATRRGRPAICPGLWFENPAGWIARPAVPERTSANPGRLAHRHRCAAFGPSGPTPG
jgi:hypothetical protein